MVGVYERVCARVCVCVRGCDREIELTAVLNYTMTCRVSSGLQLTMTRKATNAYARRAMVAFCCGKNRAVVLAVKTEK